MHLFVPIPMKGVPTRLTNSPSILTVGLRHPISHLIQDGVRSVYVGLFLWIHILFGNLLQSQSFKAYGDLRTEVKQQQ